MNFTDTLGAISMCIWEMNVCRRLCLSWQDSVVCDQYLAVLLPHIFIVASAISSWLVSLTSSYKTFLDAASSESKVSFKYMNMFFLIHVLHNYSHDNHSYISYGAKKKEYGTFRRNKKTRQAQKRKQFRNFCTFPNITPSTQDQYTVKPVWNNPLWKDHPVWKDHFPICENSCLSLDSI